MDLTAFGKIFFLFGFQVSWRTMGSTFYFPFQGIQLTLSGPAHPWGSNVCLRKERTWRYVRLAQEQDERKQS